MAIVLSILRRAHATGTHHYLALDALRDLDVAQRDSWERLFHKHIAVYVDGAKAPDKAFKDFENHVLHPRHGFWGGAVAQVETWYQETVDALTKQDWQAAAYAAGVLSHYVTDPLQPLHTHQTDAESAIHAAVEWSVSRSYVDLMALASQAPAQTVLATDASLADLMHQGATAATAHYETILAHYDIKRGVVTPEDGLDDLGRRVMAGQLRAARRCFALILARAIKEARVAPPDVSLAGDALKAFLTLPGARRRKRAIDGADRRQVEAMYDELMATGHVETTLPEDDRRIRDLFAAAQLTAATATAQAAPEQAAGHTLPRLAAAPQPAPAAPHEATAPDDNLDPDDPAGAFPAARKRVAIETPRPAPPVTPTPDIRARATAVSIKANEPDAPRNIAAPAGITDATVAEPASTEPVIAEPIITELGATSPLTAFSQSPTLADMKPVRIDPPPSARVSAALASYRPSTPSNTQGSTLSLDADVVDAPSIGPKTAERLNAVGIDTVGDFLKAHPIALAARLEHTAMSAAVLIEWQDQTRLMVALGDLRAADAKLLVGAGYRTLEAITNVEPDQLSADVLRFALTKEGQALLREGFVPDVARIRGWAMEARTVKAA
jgi:hypothetical protein